MNVRLLVLFFCGLFTTSAFGAAECEGIRDVAVMYGQHITQTRNQLEVALAHLRVELDRANGTLGQMKEEEAKRQEAIGRFVVERSRRPD